MDEFDEDQFGAAADDAARLTGEIREMRAAFADTFKEATNLDRGLSNGLRNAFDGLAFDGLKLSDALGMVASNMIDTAYAAAIKPVANGMGTAIADGISGLVAGVMPFKDGAPFSQGRVMPFALGGVVSGATTFPMRGGTGLMGEAGPEAIMPLARGSDGRLGVRTQGGGGVNINMNISTPDVTGFERSQGQIAARVARAIGQGRRNQ
ncbi:phage-related minor tail protein [Loktanella ponticola]|uniref:Phage-related minor tail protein n=1 Tax=Yoonia ponticola TaxID=1524255 RepID=A0A7W9BK84_9RHOB|nr:phage tail tape measure protein [Yoonia ponticola]MBB5722061.1 phage-related minor tail protein [Yoonia ponticola]